MRKRVSKYLWLKETSEGSLLGISKEGQEELGDITYVTLPKVGQRLEKEQPFADVEAEKAVTELVSPLTGTVKEINEKALDDASLLDATAEEDAWLLLVGDTQGNDK